MVHCCGLVTAGKKAVPLKSIEVEIKVRDHVATVSSVLLYENKEKQPIEAVFVLPLPGDAAVCYFSAKIGETEVVAEVREKQQAREDYDDALSSGRQAFLLEESKESPDVFSLSVGCLPPGESATVRMEYVTELAVQADDGLRFCLPAVLNPRYQPQADSLGASTTQITSVPASLVPYSLSMAVHVSSPRPISKIESNCSLDPLQYLKPEQTQATVSLAAGHKFDRDVELIVYYKGAHLPTVVVEAGKASAKPGSLMGDPVVMLSLYPEFPSAVMSSLRSCGEFIFLIDRSGSMGTPMNFENQQQTRIQSARDTLLLLLKSLPVGCYFNIYSFGSQYSHIFPTSVKYDQKNVDKALEKVDEMGADMGGTEIYKPLQHLYSQPCIPDQPRQLFVFTDGKVCNTKEILELVKKNADSHRCFSFGIGEGASSALITGMAKEARGHAQFITGSDRMQSKVMQSLQLGLQPFVTNISTTWDVPNGMSVITLSPPITNLFRGQRSLLYAQLSGESSGVAEGCVTVKYTLADQPCEAQLSFPLSPSEDTGLAIHRLGARTLIRSLEMEQAVGQEGGVKEKVVELSVESGISSAFTAFIAVNKGNEEAIQGPLLRRNVPAPSIHVSSSLNYRRLLRPLGRQCSTQPFMKKMSGYDRVQQCKATLCSSSALMPPLIFKHNALMSSDARLASVSSAEMSRPSKDPLLQLISLQKTTGSWSLHPALAVALGKTTTDLEKPHPAQVNQEVWATVLALVWLYGFNIQAKDEWQLLAMKTVSWLQAQKVPSIMEFVEAANVLLGCKVQKESLGL